MVQIERYFGFGVSDYEARGGFDDLICKSDVLEDVITKLKKHKKGQIYFDEYWITDMETFKPIDIDI